MDVLKISEIPTMPESRTELLRNNHHNTQKSSNQKSNSVKSDNATEARNSNNKKNSKVNANDEKIPLSNTFRSLIDEKLAKSLEIDTQEERNSNTLADRTSPIEVMQLLSNRLSFPTGISNINRQLPKTSGVCTQSSSTSGPSRIAVSSQTEKTLTNRYAKKNVLLFLIWVHAILFACLYA